MTKVFVDTDVCIDLLSERTPFNSTAEILFTLAADSKIKIFVSAITFANIDYILRSQYSAKHSRQILSKFKSIVHVLAVQSSTIDLAINSEFTDFEDAIQHYCAIESGIPLLITRNLKDYKKASIKILNPETYLSSVKF